jgi:integrase
MIGKPTKRIKHGRVYWAVEWRDEHGVRRHRFFPTKGEADAYQTTLHRRPVVSTRRPAIPTRRPDLGASGLTVADYGTQWLADSRVLWKPKTYRSYHDALVQHVLPFKLETRALGSLRLIDLSRAHVQELVKAKRGDGYAPDTVRIMVRALSGMLGAAVDDDNVLLAFNPIASPGKTIRAYLARTRMTEDDDIRAMTAEQLKVFLTTAERISGRLYPLYLAGAEAGLRLGELCGWQLGDLRLESREADVVRSLGQESSRRAPVAGTTKTGRRRTIDLSMKLLGELAKRVKGRPHEAMAAAWRPVPPWVFVTKNGTPYGHRNVERDFTRVLVAAKLMQKGEPAPFSPHSLRHTFACLHLTSPAADRNVIQWVKEQLGHSSIQVTVDTYGSWIRLRDPAAADRLDLLLGKLPHD